MPILCCQKASRIIQIRNINFYTLVRPPPPLYTMCKNSSDLAEDGFPNLAQHRCLMLIGCQDQLIHLVEEFCHEKLKLYSRGPGLLGSAMTQKKRRQDPGQEKAKEDRRRKRLTKALKKMDKKERQPKPLSECEVIENEMNTKL